MGSRWAAPGRAAFLVALSASTLAATPPPLPLPRAVRLDYIRGPNSERCPEEQDFRDAVGAKVARNFFAVDPSPAARLVVRLGRRGAGYEGTAELYDAAGAVTWTKVYPGPTHPPSSSCESVIDGLALSIAIQVDPIEAPSAPPPLPALVPVPVPVSVPVPSPSIPPPPKRSLQLVAGLDGIFTPFLAPSASAGFALWAAIDLLTEPLGFEFDLRATWSVLPARVPLMYQPLFAVYTSYVSGVFAGCWRGPVSLCPLLEVGHMSFSEAGRIGMVSRSSTLVAAGLRGVYARPITGHFVVRGLFEVEGLLHQLSPISDDTGHRASNPSPVSLTWGLGFGGSL